MKEALVNTLKESMSGFNHDNIAEEDLLGRDRFAKEIAERLVKNFPNGCDGIVMGITGQWGSGKSTLLSYLKKHLVEFHKNEPDDVRLDTTIIDFNPWLYNGQKELQAIFLKEIAVKSGNQNEVIKGFLEKLAQRLIIPKLISQVTIGVSQTASITFKDFDKVFADDPEVLKKDVNVDLINKRRKLYIFIDDLDRLEPQSIIEILQLIRMNASFKNVIYVLAYDKDYIFNALREKYRDNGLQYLDKIVQLDYALPEASEEKVQKVFFDELTKLKADLGLDIWEEAIECLWVIYEMKSFFPTLRSVYRYFNSLRFRLPVIHKEIMVEDFMILEIFRMFRHDVYKDILDYTKRSKYSDQWKEFSETYATEDISVNRLLEKLKDRSFYRRQGKKGIEKRFMDTRYTARYLALEMNNQDVSTQVVDLFLRYPDKRLGILDESRKYGRLKSLLVALQNNQLAEKYKLSETQSLHLLIDHWFDYKLEYEECNTTLFETLMNLCFLSEDKEAAFFTVINTLYGSDGKFNIAVFHLLYLLLNYFPKNSPSFRQPFKRYLQSERDRVSSFYQNYMSKWDDLFFPDIYKQPFKSTGRLFIVEFAKRNKDKYQDQMFQEIIKKDENVLELLSILLMEYNGAETEYRVDWEKKLILLPQLKQDDFNKRLRQLDEVDLLEDQKRRVDFYLNYCDVSTHDKALKYLEKELMGRRDVFGELSLEVIETLQNSGRVFMKAKRYQEAADKFQEAMHLAGKFPDGNKPSTILLKQLRDKARSSIVQ